ncbi:hypothetical protein, partial [Pedobacter jeongneungensis]|uniref:hypothetical protein n=1 Tax=Pedobacter jeongneungensis TaxID=947309 RepID=UPI001965E99C
HFDCSVQIFHRQRNGEIFEPGLVAFLKDFSTLLRCARNDETSVNSTRRRINRAIVISTVACRFFIGSRMEKSLNRVY